MFILKIPSCLFLICIGCLSYFLRCWDKIPNIHNTKERFVLGLSFRSYRSFLVGLDTAISWQKAGERASHVMRWSQEEEGGGAAQQEGEPL